LEKDNDYKKICINVSVLILRKNLLLSQRLAKNKKIDVVVEVAKVNVIISLSLHPKIYNLELKGLKGCLTLIILLG